MEVFASILAANVLDLAREVIKAEELGVNGLHVDIMDGHYVCNFGFGPQFIHSLKRLTSLPVEAHLEVEHGDSFVDLFIGCGSDIITLHPESCRKLEESLQKIKKSGVKSGLAVSPRLSLDLVDRYLSLVDRLLIMTVPPGFGGQRLCENTLPVIAEAKLRINKLGLQVTVAADGGINLDNVLRVIESGADTLVMGTALFQNPNVGKLMELIKGSSGQSVPGK